MPYLIDHRIDIAAPPQAVWRALCHPAAVVRWDTTVVAALDAPPDYPQPGQHVRWRCRDTSELLHDRPQHVEREHRLHALLDFGRLHMDETYTLTLTDDGLTRLHLHIALKVRAPFIAGLLLPHLIDGPAARRNAEASLTNLKYYCELAPG